jgi:hypothetical protein
LIVFRKQQIRSPNTRRGYETRVAGRVDKVNEMGQKVHFAALHRTLPRFSPDFSDSFIAMFSEVEL